MSSSLYYISYSFYKNTQKVLSAKLTMVLKVFSILSFTLIRLNYFCKWFSVLFLSSIYFFDKTKRTLKFSKPLLCIRIVSSNMGVYLRDAYVYIMSNLQKRYIVPGCMFQEQCILYIYLDERSVCEKIKKKR